MTFTRQVYDDENDFHGGNHAQFQEDGNIIYGDDGDQEDENDVDFVVDQIDQILDADIPEDERDDEITLPRKQKFRS